MRETGTSSAWRHLTADHSAWLSRCNGKAMFRCAGIHTQHPSTRVCITTLDVVVSARGCLVRIRGSLYRLLHSKPHRPVEAAVCRYQPLSIAEDSPRSAIGFADLPRRSSPTPTALSAPGLILVVRNAAAAPPGSKAAKRRFIPWPTRPEGRNDR
jgi:hypothetical protein